jgi:hypothetical protein
MTSSAATTEPRHGGAPRDGQHDFDFAIGKWTFHLSRLSNPLSGSNEWIDFDGESEARPIWGGRANLDTVRVESAATGDVIEGLTLRLYNTQTGEWSLYWANSRNGVLSLPPTVGRFTADGRGEFYDHEELDGRPILVRYVWSEITPTSAHFEQAFSPDDGATWETNWITDQTRITDPATE